MFWNYDVFSQIINIRPYKSLKLIYDNNCHNEYFKSKF